MLDSGGYGRVTIDKSVAITAPAGVYAGISVFAGTNGVDVDGAGIGVALRGLTINGQGGDTGIVFTQGTRLYIEQCTISNMGAHGVELLDRRHVHHRHDDSRQLEQRDPGRGIDHPLRSTGRESSETALVCGR